MKKRSIKPAGPKAVHYVAIPEQSEIGRPMYERLWTIVDAHHKELADSNVRIALAWATNWKSDVDGRLVLGKCKKASDLDREFQPFDFVILLNRDFWQDTRVTDDQRSALLDHELMHATIAYDDAGEPKRDERGRTCYRIRKHDIEEFADIVSRYGLYKRDLEDFGRAILRAEQRSASTWISYSAVHETLKAVGLAIPATVIATWPDDERREVHTWALLRQEMGEKVNAHTSQTLPACVAAALASQSSADTTAH